MDNNQSYHSPKDTSLRLAITFVLVFIIAFSSLDSFSILSEMELEKIEKLAEGETDIDIEEKEKSFEGEESPYISSNFDKYGARLDQNHNDQYMLQLSTYHLKIPTPPPDYV